MFLRTIYTEVTQVPVPRAPWPAMRTSQAVIAATESLRLFRSRSGRDRLALGLISIWHDRAWLAARQWSACRRPLASRAVPTAFANRRLSGNSQWGPTGCPAR
jgi:hypothetical protein